MGVRIMFVVMVFMSTGSFLAMFLRSPGVVDGGT